MWVTRFFIDLFMARVRAAEMLERDNEKLRHRVDTLEARLVEAQRDTDYFKAKTEALESAADRAIELAGENVQLERSLADAKAAHKVTNAHFEWLQVMFNRESVERALISQAKIGVTLPPVSVGRPTAPVTDGPAYESSSSFAPPGEPLPGQEPPPVVGEPDDGEGGDIARLEAEVGASMFEDAGDEKAAKLGARHESDGSLAYDR